MLSSTGKWKLEKNQKITIHLIFLSLCYWNKSCPELQELSGIPTQKQMSVARNKSVRVQRFKILVFLGEKSQVRVFFEKVMKKRRGKKSFFLSLKELIKMCVFSVFFLLHTIFLFLYRIFNKRQQQTGLSIKKFGFK